MSDNPPTKSALEIVGLVALLFVLACAKACLERTTSRRSTAWEDIPNPTCTLRTNPPGARVIQLCRSVAGEKLDEDLRRNWDGPGEPPAPFGGTFEMEGGTTPMSKPRLTWIMEGVVCNGPMVARLEDYQDTPISAPLEGMGCDEAVVQLTSRYAERPGD